MKRIGSGEKTGRLIGTRLPRIISVACKGSLVAQGVEEYSVVWYTRVSKSRGPVLMEDERMRNLAQSFNSKIPDSENLLVRQLEIYLF